MTPAQTILNAFYASGLKTDDAQVYTEQGAQTPQTPTQQDLLKLFVSKCLFLGDVRELDGFVREELALAELDPDMLFNDTFIPTKKLKDSYRRIGNGVCTLIEAIEKEELGSHRPRLYHSTLSPMLTKSLGIQASGVEPEHIQALWKAYVNNLMQDLQILQAITTAVERQPAARAIRENRSTALAVAHHIFHRISSYLQYDLKKRSLSPPTKQVLRELTYEIACLYMPALEDEISSAQIEKLGQKKQQ